MLGPHCVGFIWNWTWTILLLLAAKGLGGQDIGLASPFTPSGTDRLDENLRARHILPYFTELQLP